MADTLNNHVQRKLADSKAIGLLSQLFNLHARW
jgi:hypothetical protein